jgi:hypothetical protein
MTELLPMDSVLLNIDNYQNGAKAEYEFSIVPSTQIFKNDVFKITFPDEI